MRAAYVDTSALAAVVLNEAGAASVARPLATFERVLSSNLLEAELRSVFAREASTFEKRFVERVDWILPDRPLTLELSRVLAAGYLPGADLWHVATALYAAPRPEDLAFVTLDKRQAAVAGALGFETLTAPPTRPASRK